MCSQEADVDDFQMFAMVQKEKVFNETLLSHFKEKKVEIANAITKLCPFLESLRDRSFITDKMYANFQEACRNQVPIEKVVYHVLVHLEKMFDWSLLRVLFSRVNLKEYPGLIEIEKSFETALSRDSKDGFATQNRPNILQNQVDEVIVISSDSESSDEELLEVCLGTEGHDADGQGG
ncbi:nuclear body protein SP140-like protein [Nannospalax galili]|uniref:nuclear body protein SP140-like protein n=1 Tax=Nannospalax galili TaxID=1026970 RepID=UPI00111C3595|nr:nuclear body protein SP140-like protein [Nannospalax galili]